MAYAYKYCNPSATYNGDGTAASDAASPGAAGAYNTWNGVTFATNTAYRTKRGTRHSLGSLLTASSLSSATDTPLLFEAYYNSDGTDDTSKPIPIFERTSPTSGSAVLSITDCTNAVVRNIAFTGATGSSAPGLWIRRSSNVLVNNCESYGNTYGFQVYQDTTGTQSNVEFRSNYSHDNGGCGMSYRFGLTGNAGTITDIIFRNNTVTNNGVWYGTGPNGQTCIPGGIVSTSPGSDATQVHSTRCSRISMIGNTVEYNQGYGLVLYECVGGLVSSNTVRYNNLQGLCDCHAIWLGACDYMEVSDNLVQGNGSYTGQSFGSAVGILLDWNQTVTTGCLGCRVTRNRCIDGDMGTTSAVLAGGGIHIIKGTSNDIYSNVVSNHRNGISITDNGSTGNRIFNNTIYGILDTTTNSTDGYGIALHATGGSPSASVYNNVVQGATVGIHAASAYTLTEKNNVLSGVTSSATTGNVISGTTPRTPDTSTVVTISKVVSSGYTPMASLVSLGVHLGYQLDASSRLRRNPPTIGAYESV